MGKISDFCEWKGYCCKRREDEENSLETYQQIHCKFVGQRKNCPGEHVGKEVKNDAAYRRWSAYQG